MSKNAVLPRLSLGLKFKYWHTYIEVQRLSKPRLLFQAIMWYSLEVCSMLFWVGCIWALESKTMRGEGSTGYYYEEDSETEFIY